MVGSQARAVSAAPQAMGATGETPVRAGASAGVVGVDPMVRVATTVSQAPLETPAPTVLCNGPSLESSSSCKLRVRPFKPNHVRRPTSGRSQGDERLHDRYLPG